MAALQTSSPCRSYCRCRAASTRARMVSELSSCARLRAASASYSTGCTVIWRSMRSSSGPDRRRRYCCTRSFAQVQRFVPYQPHGQGFMAAMS